MVLAVHHRFLMELEGLDSTQEVRVVLWLSKSYVP